MIPIYSIDRNFHEHDQVIAHPRLNTVSTNLVLIRTISIAYVLQALMVNRGHCRGAVQIFLIFLAFLINIYFKNNHPSVYVDLTFLLVVSEAEHCHWHGKITWHGRGATMAPNVDLCHRTSMATKLGLSCRSTGTSEPQSLWVSLVRKMYFETIINSRLMLCLNLL